LKLKRYPYPWPDKCYVTRPTNRMTFGRWSAAEGVGIYVRYEDHTAHFCVAVFGWGVTPRYRCNWHQECKEGHNGT
jgi:hypothetical protein